MCKDRNPSLDKSGPVFTGDNIKYFYDIKNLNNVVVEKENFSNEINTKLISFLKDYGYIYKKEIGLFGSDELELTKNSFSNFILEMKDKYYEFNEFINLPNDLAFELFDEYKKVFNLCGNNVNNKFKRINNPEGFMISEFRKKIKRYINRTNDKDKN